MKKMHQLQTFMLDDHNDEAVAQKSMELFKVADADCTIADSDIHILGQYLNEFLEPLYPLFEKSTSLIAVMTTISSGGDSCVP